MTLPRSVSDGAALALLQHALTQQGYCFVPAALTRALLGADDAFASAWPAFAASWNNLVLDEYMADGGKYRQRRHATLSLAAGQSSFCLEPHQPHYQSLEYNPLNGGVVRHYQPVEDAVIHNPVLAHLMAAGSQVFGAIRPGVAWQVEMHQFRITTDGSSAGQPTPEGMHRDGVDFVLMVLINRHNVQQGMSTVQDPAGKVLQTFTLTEALDMAVVNDERVRHGVTAITPDRAGQSAYRDILVLTFRRKA
ncbi:2OG-Fe dioxygenase family protein [Silvimonas iriomotensis]|nr:2OG-Fe dioxygenase family protein [Silvimonas iriomotensis]